ncbi:uncharacterized protein CIMG_12611 [Coccidioides immitis RS]|uniref:Uncharacterized protein n=1 Tax=Coccidioides immitis (strain RS) TaxID=246410 RepID=A0A0D8JUJ4_COCIM|nr:uncharacterized protein CIMG_12611 [Coccidioides immitis RS]KJF59938.1 hypothetical protein CIMG_12611 [Coccidioides immitis RS]
MTMGHDLGLKPDYHLAESGLPTCSNRMLYLACFDLNMSELLPNFITFGFYLLFLPSFILSLCSLFSAMLLLFLPLLLLRDHELVLMILL